MDAEILQATLDAIPKDQKDSSGKQVRHRTVLLQKQPIT